MAGGREISQGCVVMQEISSADTCRRQVPAVIKLVEWEPRSVNLDVGGGRYEDTTVYLKRLKVTNLVYDPFNRSAKHNRAVLQRVIDHGGADSVTLMNVLNVIQKPYDRRAVLRISWKLLREGHPIYIGIYDGDKSGEGKKTRDGWQENRRASTYLSEVGRFFKIVKSNAKLIVGRRRSNGQK